MLMLILANVSGVFGRVTILALVASLGTRLIRLSPLTGIIVGVGYALGGLIFDMIFFGLSMRKGKGRSGTFILLAASIISGTFAMAPYVIFKFLILNKEAFIALTPIYAISTLKGTIFSVVGTIIGLSIIPRIKSVF
jgi:uncharacterized membrane protein YciS (DUF1049 family)